MADINWNVSYAPAQAEDGKFVAIDSNSISGYTGYGRFALLTYLLNPPTISLSGSNVSVAVPSAYSISNFQELIDKTYNYLPLSSIVTVQNSNINVTIKEPNTIWIGTSSFAAQGKITPTLPANLNEIEIQNLTEGSVYVILSATTYADAISKGILISEHSFYSTKKQISNITIASLSGGDIRIMGHYHS